MCIENKNSGSCEVDTCSIVKMLLLSPADQKNLTNKCEILKLGRPTPILQTLTLANNKINALNFFKNYTWITGCPALNKIFCWPCLFFDNFDITNPWSNGIDDTKLDINWLYEHSKSSGHKNASKQCTKFGKHVSDNQKLTTDLHLDSTLSTRDIQNNSSQPSTSNVNIENDSPAIVQHDASKEVLPIPVGSSCNINLPQENTRNYFIKQSTNCHSSICDTLSNIQKLLQMEPTKYTKSNNGNTNITITQEKYDIFLLGRPMPKLKLVETEEKEFQNEFYNRFDWLTGCTTTNKLFCWPCLFFNKISNAFSKKGGVVCRPNMLNSIYNILKIHCKNNANHLKAVEMYNQFSHDHGISNGNYLLNHPSDSLETTPINNVSMI
jgi:hypothetical protein